MLNEIADFFLSNKNEQIVGITQINHQYNSEVYYINTENQSYIVKHYIDQNDVQERIQREVSFLSAFKYTLENRIPKLYFYNDKKGFLCESFVQGVKSEPSSRLIQAILDFIRDINLSCDINTYTEFAKDAILHSKDLFDNLRLRSKKWLTHESQIMVRSAIETLKLIENPNFQKKVDSFLQKNLRMLISPSDIGPHNILLNDNYVFFDFEYAGIDSNFKLGLDLVTQPDIDFFKFANMNSFNYFNEVLGFSIKEIPSEIIGLFMLKWIFISSQKHENAQSNKKNVPLKEFNDLERLEKALWLCYNS
jgi:hypothetical protein